MGRGLRGAWLAAAAAGALAGCAGNRELGPGGVPASPAYRYDILSSHTDAERNSDEVLIIVALSGGGARSASLGFGVFEKLAASRIRVSGSAAPRSVLAEVDIMSTNSGGSFLAAYYAVHREAMFRADASGRTAFERDFLKRPLSAELMASLVLSAPRLADGSVSRTDVAAELFGRAIFADRTYGDIVRLGRPYLIVNAHDTTKRARFEFTQEQFDLICSDLGSVPLARAVMASSAVHGIFTPLKLRNHIKERCPPEPPWMASALRGEGDPANIVDAPRARRQRGELARWYREKLPDGAAPPPGAEFFVHLADGAAVDNLGLRAPIFALASRDSALGLARLVETGRIKRILLIAVNAATGPDPLRDADPNGPSALQSMRDAADGLIRTVSEDSLRELQHVFARLRAAAQRNGGNPAVYGPVVIDFDSVEDSRLRNCFKRIPTTLDLPAADIDALRDAGRTLLTQSAEFRRFLRDHGGEEQALLVLQHAGRFCPARPASR